MNDLRSETLIRRLAQEATPVRPILRPVVAGAAVLTAWVVGQPRWHEARCRTTR